MHYDTIGRKITMSQSLNDLSNRDKIQLAWFLMSNFAPDLEFSDPVENYERYQDACKVILDEMNKYWDKPPHAFIS
jgi:hypothetical protein